MELTIILAFYAGVLGLGFLKDFRKRRQRERVFFMLVFLASLSVVVLKSLGIVQFNLTLKITEIAERLGLAG